MHFVNTGEKARLLDEAESLLVAAYEGMKQREAAIPPQAALRFPEAFDRLIDLYTMLKKPEEVQKYREIFRQPLRLSSRFKSQGL